jgi:hypothetical protein
MEETTQMPTGTAKGYETCYHEDNLTGQTAIFVTARDHECGYHVI